MKSAIRWAVRLATAAASLAAVVCLAGAISPAASFAARSRVRHGLTARAPGGPPLDGSGAAPAGEDEQGSGVPSAAGDQLVENGLSSPLCRGGIAGGLSDAARADCRASGFVGAAAPTNDYALDVHIDTGALGLGKGGLLSVIQDVFVAPIWGAIGWLVHALLVLIEWCYALELLGGRTSGAAAVALAQARAGFTDPWLALVLSLASLLALHHGLVRRRVADTLGGAVTMLAMMAGGLWVIADPAGTVGAIGRWADQASLGTLAATTSGSPSSGAATLGESMRELYLGAIETPWCYLEFGNVRWCADPALLEPPLRAAAFALAAHERAHGLAAADVDLIHSARTNGALFLAFPANKPARNSINDEGSLLRAICRSSDATKCHGPAASEAEFRTDGGTMPRVLGLLAIAVGVLGMALLFGLLALRLLAAAFLGLLLLLLAPFAVLAPAFGDGGRALFAGWLARLLGAVTSKLLFSFVLGALLTAQRILISLDSFGWWTQWLLLSAFWWLVFLRRHQAAAALRTATSGSGRTRDGGAGAGPGGAGGWLGSGRSGGQGSGGAAQPGSGPAGAGGVGGRRGGPLERTAQTYGAIRHPARWTKARANTRLAPAGPRSEERLGQAGREAGFVASRREARLRGVGQRISAVAERGAAESDGATLAANEIDERSRRRRSAVAASRSDDGGLGDGGQAPSPLDTATRPDAPLWSEDGQAPSPLDTSTRPDAPLSSDGGQAVSPLDTATRPDAPPSSDTATRAEGCSGANRHEQREPGPARPAGGAGVDELARASRQGASVPGAGAAALEPNAPVAPRARSRIMEDALAVAERRKRQLGFDEES